MPSLPPGVQSLQLCRPSAMKTWSLPSIAIEGVVHDLLDGFERTLVCDQLPPRLVMNHMPPRPVAAMSTALVLSTTIDSSSNWPPSTLTGDEKDAGAASAGCVDAPTAVATSPVAASASANAPSTR